MIPKIIWQTYKDKIDDLPDYAVQAMSTWMENNPGWEHRYVDDSEARDFIVSEYGNEYAEIFDNLPVPVMRGDMWRYLVIYKYGGVYADLDTVCLSPIDSWIGEDYSMVVCPENNLHFCQWAFAAEPGHPVMKSVVEAMINRLRNPDYSIKHFVHIHTGPGVWTEGIYNGLGINKDKHNCGKDNENGVCEHHSLILDSIEYNGYMRTKELGFHCYSSIQEDEESFYGWRIFHNKAIKHIYGSQNWNDGRYTQWIKDELVKGIE